MFVLNSDITIGNFRFEGVHEVQINRSLYSIVDTARIKLPSIAKVVGRDEATATLIITGKQFNDGDSVVIKLGYNGLLEEEFRGFVVKRNMNMPLEVECEGNSWLLKRIPVSGFHGSIPVKDLLNIAVNGLTGARKISVQCDVDIVLHNVALRQIDGFDVVNLISQYTEECLSCFFIEPGVLWCGLLYSSLASGNTMPETGRAELRIGYNVTNANDLKLMVADFPAEVKYTKRLSAGGKLAEASDVFKDGTRKHKCVLNHVQDGKTLKALANEKSYQLNYAGYSGGINAFLQPYVQPGYIARITDVRQPERDGDYIVESTEVHFGIGGARRKVEIGAKVSFAKS